MKDGGADPVAEFASSEFHAPAVAASSTVRVEPTRCGFHLRMEQPQPMPTTQEKSDENCLALIRPLASGGGAEKAEPIGDFSREWRIAFNGDIVQIGEHAGEDLP
jgi:hypothetical protein